METHLIPVMIVEDEYLVRLGMRTVIPWEEHGMTLVCEAENGKIALEKFQEFNPSIVITDIRMPEMDGMELIQELKALKPNLAIIILSSFENFEYARTAIKYGIADYLIKSGMESQELLNCLQSVINTKGIESLSSTPKQKGHSNFFSCRLTEHYHNSEARMIMDKLKFRSTQNGYNILLQIIHENDSTTLQLTMKSIKNIFSEIFELPIGFEQPRSNQLLFYCKSNPMEWESKIQQFSELLTTYIQQKWYMYQSEAWNNPEKLILETKNSFDSILNGFIQGPNSIFFQGKSINSLFDKSCLQTIHCLCGAILVGDINGASKYLDNLCSLFQEENTSYVSFTKLFDNLVDLTKTFIEMRFRMLGQSLQSENSFPILHSKNFPNIIELKETYINLLKNHSLPFKDFSCSPIVRQILTILYQKYSASTSLEELSSEVQVTSTYLCSRFKKETGVGVIPFLNHLRIGHSLVILISKPTAKMYEIAETCGYQDSAYFSRMFKLIMEKSPSEYQQNYFSPQK